MQSQICISKKSFMDLEKTTETDLILDIKYNHPELTLIINSGDFYSLEYEFYSYSYTGSIPKILEFNEIKEGFVNAEYFISGIKNINYFDINETSVVISFPLSINYVDNIIKIVLDAKMHTDQNYIINKVSEKLTSKIIELENENRIINEKYRMLECKIVELEKINRESTHLDMTLSFDEGEGNPIIFSNNVTSLNLVFDCEEITSEIILPQNLLNFKMECKNIVGYKFVKSISRNIVFPNTLVRLNLYNLVCFNQPLDFKNDMPNIKELSLELLDEFNHYIDVPDTLEKLTIIGLSQFKQLVVIPENIKFVDFRSGSPRIYADATSTIKYQVYDNSYELSIKCFSQNNEIIKSVLDHGGGYSARQRSFRINKENFIRTYFYTGKEVPSHITFF
jgi:hypothetical protein